MEDNTCKFLFVTIYNWKNFNTFAKLLLNPFHFEEFDKTKISIFYEYLFLSLKFELLRFDYS